MLTQRPHRPVHPRRRGAMTPPRPGLLAWFRPPRPDRPRWTLLASSAIAGLAAIAVLAGLAGGHRAPLQPVDGEAVIAFSSTIFGDPAGGRGDRGIRGRGGRRWRLPIADGRHRAAPRVGTTSHAILLAVAASASPPWSSPSRVAFAGGGSTTFGLRPVIAFSGGVPASQRVSVARWPRCWPGPSWSRCSSSGADAVGVGCWPPWLGARRCRVAEPLGTSHVRSVAGYTWGSWGCHRSSAWFVLRRLPVP